MPMQNKQTIINFFSFCFIVTGYIANVMSLPSQSGDFGHLPIKFQYRLEAALPFLPVPVFS